MIKTPQSNDRASWTAQRLKALATSLCGGESLVVLANREPFRHEPTPEGDIVVRRSGGGLVTALEPLIQACSGVWVAHGSGVADRLVVDWRDGVSVPPGDPMYRLRRVWLDEHEERGYYQGFANEGLWPMCHRAHVQPVFRTSDFNMYREVNARFVEAVCDEVETEAPIVLVQDYHFALAPRMIRERLPQSTVITFWHIPWPTPRDFEICPWGRDLLHGLLGSSVIGFQTPCECRNFIETVERSLRAEVNHPENVVTYAGRRTTARAYPVSIEWPSRRALDAPSVTACRESVRHQLGLDDGVRLAVGVDRLDYTKGIEEKFLAVERLLEMYPAFRGRFVLAQIAEPSRSTLPAYRDLRARVVATLDRINNRFETGGVKPLVMLEAHPEPPAVYRFLRAAEVCYVGSLHDGMNLVAKEFVSARDDERGVLMLSEFTGSARELSGAVIVNPYAIDDSANALAEALTMSGEEQGHRMRTMRATVAGRNTYWWAGQLLQEAQRLRQMPGARGRGLQAGEARQISA